MNREAQLRLLERVKKLAWGIFLEPGLREDLAHEAWIRAVEYAKSRGKPLDTLSKIEIRNRCFEAARKLRGRELREADFAEDAANPLAMAAGTEHVTERLSRSEIATAARNKVDRIEWLLRVHPTMAFTSAQWAVYREVKEEAEGSVRRWGWQSQHAKKLGVTRQNIANIVRLVRRRAAFMADLVELVEGNVPGFFQKYASHWNAPWVRKGLWPIIRNVNAPEALRAYIGTIARPMAKEAQRILLGQAVPEGRHVASDASELARGYYLLIAAARMSPATAPSWLSDLRSSVPHHAWLIQRFISRGLHMVDEQAREEDRGWLVDLATRGGTESQQFANYIVCYYGGFEGDGEAAATFLESGGRQAPAVVHVAPVVRETYANITEAEYTQSKSLLDINFLRMLLVFSMYPPRKLEPPTANALVTICQKSAHSADPSVARRAELLLEQVQARAVTSS